VADPAAERTAATTWQRLRRRKVVQWGIAYVAAAWGFLQGLEYVVDSFGWPVQLRQVAILALLVGLPIALVIAWYHGDRGVQRVSGTEVTVIALLLLLGGMTGPAGRRRPDWRQQIPPLRQQVLRTRGLRWPCSRSST
jgi:hypothetical protein